MSQKSTMQRIVGTVNMLPNPLRQKTLSLLLGKLVPYVGTSSLIIEEMTEARVVTIVRNQKHVRNHIGQVHAVAMALAVETATGFVTAMNLPEDKLPLIKSMKVDYKKRTKGDMRAVATLTADQREKILTEDRGNVEVEVHVTDETGEEPIQCTAIWAWVPKKK